MNKISSVFKVFIISDLRMYPREIFSNTGENFMHKDFHLRKFIINNNKCTEMCEDNGMGNLK